MKILLNGEPCEVAARDLDTLLAELDVRPDAVATALNREFVPRGARGSATIAEGDAVEILSPMKGG
ncbi:sulfur carrier protein ThiS [uncultured Aureimonas sp.]|uniref:sulfur carrier protein ThiS n=1 Tax=uncultured Aureimonas sp. TaxID=1604662 RepID=UPI0025D7FC66|nr:sulfur carrier protein ThiS [uncultured Aureimonas sp.]